MPPLDTFDSRMVTSRDVGYRIRTPNEPAPNLAPAGSAAGDQSPTFGCSSECVCVHAGAMRHERADGREREERALDG